MLLNKFNIYPNPGSGSYIVNTGLDGNYLVEVFNSYGAKVKSVSFKGKVQEVNIENLTNGMYTFTIKGDAGNYIQKIIKQ